jgi:hypothetical protein
MPEEKSTMTTNVDEIPDPFEKYGYFHDEDGAWERHAKEHERRRKIGEKLDPKTALTAYWYCIDIDPYDCIPVYEWREEAGSSSECMMFARDPNARHGDWVHADDLPDGMYDVLSKRNDHLFHNGSIEIVMEAVERFREETNTVPEHGTGFWIGPTAEGGCAVYWRMKDGAEGSYVINKWQLKGDPREARRWTRAYINSHLSDLTIKSDPLLVGLDKDWVCADTNNFFRRPARHEPDPTGVPQCDCGGKRHCKVAKAKEKYNRGVDWRRHRF